MVMRAPRTRERRYNGDHSTLPAVAAMQERVNALGDDIHALDKRVEGVIRDINTKMDAQFSGIMAKIDERGRTPWGIIWAGLGVLVVAMSAFGAVVYAPIDKEQAALSAQVNQVREDINSTQDRVVPRAENEARWQSFDKQHADLKAIVAQDVGSLQRQIDELSGQYRSIFTPRDEIADVQHRLDVLEQDIRQGLMRPGDGIGPGH